MLDAEACRAEVVDADGVCFKALGEAVYADDGRAGSYLCDTFGGPFVVTRCDEENAIYALAKERHHVDFELVAALGIEDDEEVSALASGGFSSADDLGEEGNCDVGDDDAERVRAIGLEAAGNEVGPVVEGLDGFKDFATCAIAHTRRTADDVGDSSGRYAGESGQFPLRCHLIHSTVDRALRRSSGLHGYKDELTTVHAGTYIGGEI